MTEQQGWTAPRTDQADAGAEGTTASAGPGTSPRIPHQAVPGSGAAWTAPVSGSGYSAAPPAAHPGQDGQHGQHGLPTTGTGYVRPDQAYPRPDRAYAGPDRVAAPATGYPAAATGYPAPAG